MFKRHRTSYSLWPEQARPRRGQSLKFAAGSFAFGVVCAAAASGVIFNFGAPAAAQRQDAARTVQHVPVYASAVDPTVTPAPAKFEGESRSDRTRMAAAKVKLPVIGSQTDAVPLAATGGGGDSEKLAGEAPEADVAANAGRPASLARQADEPAREPQAAAAKPEEAKPADTAPERRGKPRKTIAEKTREAPTRPAGEAREARESEPAREPQAAAAKPEEAKPADTATERRGKPQETIVEKTPEAPTRPAGEAREAREVSEPAREPRVREARSDEAKPAAATERRAKPIRNLAEKKREGSASHVARNRQKREEPPRLAKRQRQDQSSPTIMEAAARALRMFTESQGMLGM